MSNELQLSKRLTWLLRHGAFKENLPIRSDGFVPVEALLRHPKFGHNYSLELLQKIVRQDSKRRFTLQRNPSSGSYEIRANQGHSINVVLAEHCFERIQSPEEVPLAVHGTYYCHWPSIKATGLKTMGRTHVHFAAHDDCSLDLTESHKEDTAISGFRQNCEILIYLNARKVMEESNMELYRSSNNVILSAGQNGCIPKEYFAKAVDRRTGKPLEF